MKNILYFVLLGLKTTFAAYLKGEVQVSDTGMGMDIWSLCGGGEAYRGIIVKGT